MLAAWTVRLTASSMCSAEWRGRVATKYSLIHWRLSLNVILSVLLLIWQTQIKTTSSDAEQAQSVIVFWLDVLTKLPGWHKERFALRLSFCLFSLSSGIFKRWLFLSQLVMWMVVDYALDAVRDWMAVASALYILSFCLTLSHTVI